ncbi:hypothetical protein EK0264_04120 [Epidermidibacterium keratini]|uniref:Uncharacterized protein n=1 Tax=Epidermidibacterium keratini TaxID=1891644 RepID=A0A7L4YJV4_9ACTN|nr:hypothetical protein [Epidermidibacterium keratini]QHB99550.1 hypothetical protein EK0264_04120 [Epidermidibacterium keratini]
MSAQTCQPEETPVHIEVVAVVAHCVTELEQIGRAAELTTPAVARAVERVAQQIAGTVIDRLREWPS